MKVARVVLLAAASVLVVAPALAAKKKPAAPPCIKGKVLTAFQMRMLQNELMVAGLSCKIVPRYNEFVISYKADLLSAHYALLGHFKRESRMEDYKSKIANETSQRSLANVTEFCNYRSQVFDFLLGPERPKLSEYVAKEQIASFHGQTVCEAPAVVEASAGKVVPMPRQKPEGVAPVITPAAAASEPKPEVASTAPTTTQQ